MGELEQRTRAKDDEQRAGYQGTVGQLFHFGVNERGKEPDGADAGPFPGHVEDGEAKIL